jgi:excisionase family DNA binding protein
MDKQYRIADAAKYLGVSTKTLRRWDDNGKLKAIRSEGDQRYYSQAQLDTFQNLKIKDENYNANIKISEEPKIQDSKFQIPNSRFQIPVLPKFAALAVIPVLTFLLLNTISTFRDVVFKGIPDSRFKIQDSKVLPAATSNLLSGYTLKVNTPAVFSEGVTFKKDIIAPNVLYSLETGSGLSITEGQNPVITNTGVLSLGGSVGALSLSAGTGISVSGLTVSNSDTGSAQNIFKTISALGQESILADSNTDIFTLTGAGGITLTTDALTDALTITGVVPDYTLGGWTKSGTTIYNTTLTDKVGIGTATPQYNLEVAGTGLFTDTLTANGALGVTGLTNLNGNVTFGNAITDAVTFTGRLADGTSILPNTDLGSDLGSSDLRFDNILVANIYSNLLQTFSGQTTFSYAPTDSTVTQASVLVNPTTSALNGQLLGFAVGGYEKAVMDAEGDLTLGYSGVASAPINNYQLSIFNHGTTQVASIDTSGNLSLANGAKIKPMADAVNTLGITDTAGTSLMSFDTTNMRVGIGTTAPGEKISVMGDIASMVTNGTEGFKLTDTSDVTKMALKWTTDGATLDTPSGTSLNKLTNGGFETDVTTGGWTGNSLLDQFTTSAPTTLVSGVSTLSNSGMITPAAGTDLWDAPAAAFTSGTYGWVNQGTNTQENDSNSLKVTFGNDLNGSYLYLQDAKDLTSNLTIGTWYQFLADTKVNAGSGVRLRFYDGTGSSSYSPDVTSTTFVTVPLTNRATSAIVALVSQGNLSAGEIVWQDNLSLKPLTLSSLFSTVSTSTANVIASVTISSATAGTQAGLVLNLDSASSPANFILVYHDGSNLKVDEAVAGVYTNKQSTAVALGAGALKVWRNGTKLIVTLNGTQVGTTLTNMTANTNTIHGLFSTLSTNSFTNFLITTNLDGTQAEPTGGTRTVVDTQNKLSITGGQAVFAGGVTDGNPGLWYQSTKTTAVKILMDTVSDSNVTLGYTYLLGLDTNTASYPGETAIAISNSSFLSVYQGTPINIGAPVNNISYQIATVLKSTGNYVFIKGGTYTNWTLMYIENRGSTSPLYPTVSNGVSSTLTADNIRIPTNLWLPTPLAYDTFTATGSATTETAGPDAQTTPALSWTGGTKASGTMSITPTTGSEVAPDNNAASTVTEADATAGYIAGNGATITSVTDNRPGSSGTKALNMLPVINGNSTAIFSYAGTTGSWYLFNLWYKNESGASFGTWDTSNAVFSGWVTETNWTNRVSTLRAGSGSKNFGIYTSPAAKYNRADDISLKPLTLSSLFSSVSTSTNDVIADANITSPDVGVQAGIALNLDSATNPTEGVIVYLTRTDTGTGATVTLERFNTATSWTTVRAATAVVYSAGATLRVIKEGTKIRMYYNNALVGGEDTISTATIVDNTIHGLFSTSSTNTFDNFTLWARGTGGEYTTGIPDADLTATRDTTIKYAGTSSLKLVAGTNDNAYTQSVTLPDTNPYLLNAYAYTDGTDVTALDVSLYWDGSPVLSTVYSSVGNGWYKLSASFAGVASPKNYGVEVKAGKTVYLDSLGLFSTTASGSTLGIANSTTGLGGLSVVALVVKGFLGQSANLAEWQDSLGTVLASINSMGYLATAQVNATSSAGLKLYDDGGNGIFVKDGGNVGIMNATPSAVLDVLGTAWLHNATSSGLFVNSAGNVGIGTLSPSYTLDVDGSGGFSQSLTMGANAPVNFTSASNASIASPVSGSLQFTTAGLEAMRINSSGNIGIGSTSPTARLTINGTTEQFRLGYDLSNYWAATVSATGALSLGGFGTGGALTLTPTSGQNINLGISGLGKVLIGATTSPIDKLQVLGATGSAGLKIVSGGVDKLAFGYGLSSAFVDVQSDSSNNKFTNFNFDSSISGWDYGNTLEDTFTTAKTSTQLVANNTTAEPTGQLRTAVDTNGKLSITGGQLSFATGGVGVGDPGLWYSSVTRDAGKILLAEETPNTRRVELGWYAGTSGEPSDGFNFGGSASNVLDILWNGANYISGGSYTSGSNYKLATVMRGTGMYYFVKGGTEYPNWTFFWSHGTSATNRYPGIGANTSAGVATADNIKILPHWHMILSPPRDRLLQKRQVQIPRSHPL